MKIKEEQLTKIKDQQEKLNELIHNIGLLESQKHGLLHEIAKVNVDIEEYKQELEKEYGAININLEDGTYTEIKEEEEETPVAAV
jgi:vacuolar-type H+-ATPase subunit D/Vma8